MVGKRPEQVQRAHGLLLSLLFLLTLTAACRPAADPAPGTPPVSAQIPSPAPSLTVSPAHTRTPAPSPAPTASPLPTGTPTSAAPATATGTPPPTPCAEAGRVLASTFPSTLAGGDHRYRIYLPPCYGADGRVYPTLLLLAGNIHDESKWEKLGIGEAATAAIREETLPPLLIVMPDGGWLANNTSGGPGSYERLILDELLPHVEAEYCAWADPAGRAIGGLSRGGYWALEIAFRFPELFASVGGHSAALLDQYAGPAVNPQQTGVSNQVGDLRIYLDIGADDYLRENTIRLHEEMAAAGVPHTWHLNEGRHEDAYWAAHLADYLHWYAAPWPASRMGYPGCE